MEMHMFLRQIYMNAQYANKQNGDPVIKTIPLA